MSKKMFLIIFMMAFFISCKKHKLPSVAEDYHIMRYVQVYLKDSTGINLIDKNGEKYNSDSVKLFLGNDFKNITGGTILDSNNHYLISLLYLYQAAFEEKDINNFFIDLPENIYLNQSDTDTLEVKKNFNEAIRFYYNGEFIDSKAALDKNIPILYIRK